MENSSGPVTGNPQQSATTQDVPVSSGFQETVSGDDLRSQTGDISVQQTGEPVTNSMEVSAVKENTTYVWFFIVVFIIAIGLYLLVKLVKESSDEDDSYDESKDGPSQEATSRKTIIKKKSAKKKSAPNQRRKKVSKTKTKPKR